MDDVWESFYQIVWIWIRILVWVSDLDLDLVLVKGGFLDLQVGSDCSLSLDWMWIEVFHGIFACEVCYSSFLLIILRQLFGMH